MFEIRPAKDLNEPEGSHEHRFLMGNTFLKNFVESRSRKEAEKSEVDASDNWRHEPFLRTPLELKPKQPGVARQRVS